jgi:hypothetical protein
MRRLNDKDRQPDSRQKSNNGSSHAQLTAANVAVAYGGADHSHSRANAPAHG